MAKEKILVVEDDEDILELIDYNLSRENYRVFKSVSGEEALRLANREQPALVVLDLMLPGMDGLEVCRRFKGNPKTANIPIVMVTAKGEESDVVSGLELGADDYVVKPFSPKVLLARIRNVLRRLKAEDREQPDKVYEGHGVSIHPGRREVRAGTDDIDLTFTEFNILQFLVRRPGWVFTRSQIVDAVRGNDYHVTERSVDVHVLGLRKKLGKFGNVIETVRGVGYRFKE
ncbi:MAG: response regulator transcription factor [Proteobacteria bacterium]|nr:response regulator transcription factor [Pseudomonadota bacterium]